MRLRLSHTPLQVLPALVCAAALTTPCAWAQSADLATKSGAELGLSLSSYKYEEPSYMNLKATTLGFDYSGTYAFGAQWPQTNSAWFVQGDLRYASGKADYQSPISGSISGTPNWYMEARGLVGKDFNKGSYMLSPYIGLGYRHLYNNLGYTRDSYYTSLPIGLTHKMNLDDRAQLWTTVEYMHLLSGVQKTKLATQNVSLDQHKGSGWRFSVMKRFENWSMGPTLTYWRIPASDVGGSPAIVEPQNNTLELGLKLAYRF